MFPLTIFSAGLGLIGIGVAVDGLLSTALIVLGLATCVGSAFLFLFRGNEAPAGEGHTVKGGRHAQAAGGDAYMAGRDIHINPLEDSRGLSRAAQLRQVRDEIQHILRRCGQLEKHRKEWETVWPVKSFAPYQRLPAEKWNAHGAALHLPQEDHDLIQAAYELANDFNVVMERGPQTYGDPEPDLDGLRQAFEQAAAALPVDGQPAGPSPPLGPYAQATAMQQGWHRKELRVAMRTVTEDELHNLVRPRLVNLLERRTTTMQLATAQWTKRHERIREDATSGAYQAGAAAYRSLVDLHADLKLEGRKKRLTQDEIERVRQTLALVDEAVQILRADSP